MTFENFFIVLRDDHFSELRCQEPLQPPDTLQFLDVFSDTRFENAVQLRYLMSAPILFYTKTIDSILLRGACRLSI